MKKPLPAMRRPSPSTKTSPLPHKEADAIQTSIRQTHIRVFGKCIDEEGRGDSPCNNLSRLGWCEAESLVHRRVLQDKGRQAPYVSLAALKGIIALLLSLLPMKTHHGHPSLHSGVRPDRYWYQVQAPSSANRSVTHSYVSWLTMIVSSRHCRCVAIERASEMCALLVKTKAVVVLG